MVTGATCKRNRSQAWPHPPTWPRLEEDGVTRPAGCQRRRQGAKLRSIPVAARAIVWVLLASRSPRRHEGRGEARAGAGGAGLVGAAAARRLGAAGLCGRVRDVQPGATVQGQVTEALQSSTGGGDMLAQSNELVG